MSSARPASADKLVYAEKDDTYYMGIGRTASNKYICIVLHATVSDEARCATAANPARWTVVEPRQRDLLYTADNVDGRWIVQTNWQAPNYRLMTVSDADLAKGRAAWRDLVPTSDKVFIETFKPFRDFVAIEERSDGNKRIRLLGKDGKSSFVASDEPAYAMTLDVNKETGTPWVRYTYDSLTTPETTIEANALTGERRTLKVQPVPGYDAAKYVTERVWAPARDGTLMRRISGRRDCPALPICLWQLMAIRPTPRSRPICRACSIAASSMPLPIFAAGRKMGRKWFDEGKVLKKRKQLHRLYRRHALSRRAGLCRKGPRRRARRPARAAWLMGGVANMAPQDYGVIVAQVPFVDVVTTMLDDTIPLTTGEYGRMGQSQPEALLRLYAELLALTTM